ncbi:hypothetical protein LZ198_35080 [Myxococcus sp. K15C18031901]|uniref:hypothetical protein n=1 Tax=Myxococcus dinghuensis TaxID=2906761 RepID=UPI0020A833DF|nr:hypothetical protein [Myxococcus dinghuensis]MCP3104108.1 hypothetical protein [Myxococcus dinghuensis]
MTTRLNANLTATVNLQGNGLASKVSSQVGLARSLGADRQLLGTLNQVVNHGRPVVQHGCHGKPDLFDQHKLGQGALRKLGGGDWQPLDTGALRETARLDQTKGPVTAEQLTQAIERGTADLDNQAAGGEYRAFEEWAQKNGDRLTPEAKQVMDLYSKAAAKAQAQGQTGIPVGEWNQLVKDMRSVGDKSMERQLAHLDGKPGPISGEDLARAIERGVRDTDGQTHAEAKALSDWAKKNQGKLSPEAKEVLSTFERHAKKVTESGSKDFSKSELRDLHRAFKNIGDVSAQKALAKLDKDHGSISGEDMLKAIKEGVSDADGHSSTSELRDFKKWAEKNQDRLTPEARQVLSTYEKHAKKAGRDGLDKSEFKDMVKDASQFKTFRDDSMRAALDKLDNKSGGTISGRELIKAISKGAGDADGQAAGVEFADLQKWARDNYSRLSPDAKRVLGIYERTATNSLAKGETGIANGDFKKMLGTMNLAVAVPVLRRIMG